MSIKSPGNTISKTTQSSQWGDSGASSTKAILENTYGGGNGYVMVTADSTATDRMFGLSNGDSNQDYSDIDFALEMQAGGGIRIYEDGALKADQPATYAVGDVLKVGVQFDWEARQYTVRWYKNNQAIYTHYSATVSFPLLLDTALYTPNGQVKNAYICGDSVGVPTPTPTPTNTPTNTPTPPTGNCVGCKAGGGGKAGSPSSPSSPSNLNAPNTPIALAGKGTLYIGGLYEEELPACQPVAWTNAVNVSVSGNTITKNAGAVGWNAGASSTNSIAAGQDGFVQSVAVSRANHTIFGLSNGDSNQDYSDIDYAIHLQGQTDGWPGDLKIFEGGVEKRNFGPIYSAGDIFRVAVEQGVVKYYRNGALLYTSAQAPTYPLVMDTALFHVGAQIKDAVLYAGSGPGGSLSMPSYTTYYSFGGKLVGMRRANYPSANSNGQYRIVGDHLGSTTLVVDTASPPNVVQRQYSKPYGETAWQYTAQSTGGKSLTNVGYTGQRSDEDSTGLMFYNARMYDPVLSAFVSADTIAANPADPTSRNRYSYTFNNPLRYNDPTGHCTDPAHDSHEYKEGETCDSAVSTLRHYGFIVNSEDWEHLSDLLLVIQAIEDMMRRANWSVTDFKAALGIDADHMIFLQNKAGACKAATACVGDLKNPGSSWKNGEYIHNGARYLSVDLTVLHGNFGNGADYEEQFKSGVVHELAHIWDDACNLCHTKRMASYVSAVENSTGRRERPPYRDDDKVGRDYNNKISDPDRSDGADDFAEAVAAYVYPHQSAFSGGIRSDYMSSARATYAGVAMYLASHTSHEEGPGH